MLDELRSGEICNACVLLVKRFQKLPKSSKKDWSHVVDARSGPGIKTAKAKALKVKNAEDSGAETPEKILKKKHVYRRKKQAKPVKKEAQPEDKMSEFLDSAFWKK